MRKRVAMGGCVLILGCAAPSALAGNGPANDAYSGNATQVNAALAAAPRTTQAGGGGSELPMTGMDLSVIGAAGLGLAGMGVALRRLAGRQEQDKDWSNQD